MLNFFKCKHPANMLHALRRHETVEVSFGATPEEDVEEVTYHLYCMKCLEPIDIKFARFVKAL